LSEYESNHDIPEKQSNELFISVLNFYNSLINDVFNSNLCENEKMICINRFLFCEATNILFNSYENRGDYHSVYKDWSDILNKNFEVQFSTYNKQNPFNPRVMNFFMSSK